MKMDITTVMTDTMTVSTAMIHAGELQGMIVIIDHVSRVTLMVETKRSSATIDMMPTKDTDTLCILQDIEVFTMVTAGICATAVDKQCQSGDL